MTGQTDRDEPIEQLEYLIDHFCVTYQHSAAWHCSCREFASADACRHTREAAGMREAQSGMLRHIVAGKSGLRRYTPRSR
ncbi:MAG: hypothetical protein H7Y89_16025 [Steroidobacteraceae bacterium]|nr:hypothetical protein [Steroidobacteraceae bacterium]